MSSREHQKTKRAASVEDAGPQKIASGEPAVEGSPLEWFRQYGHWIAYALILLPVLLCLYYVHTYAVNVVWEDQGDGLLPLFEKWDQGTLGIGDFWKAHAEHHHFFPRLVMFGLAFLTRWNTVAEMYFIQALLMLTLAVFARVLYRECRSGYAVWWLLPLPWLVFTLRQSQNLLFGWQIVYVMGSATAAAALYALYVLKSPGWLKTKYAAAVGIATVSSFSIAQGLMLWPVGLAPLMLLPYSRNRRRTMCGIWIAVGAVEWAVYFWGFHQPPNHPPHGFSLEYFLIALGGSLFPIALLATVAGVVILVLAAINATVSATSRKLADDSFWIAAILFGTLIQLEVTWGRSGFGIGQAMSGRYATYSMFIVLGIYGLASSRLATGRSPLVAAVWGVLLGLIVLGIPLSIVAGMQEGEQLFKQPMEYQAFVFATSESQPDEVVQTDAGPEAPAWREGLKLLKKLHWNVFSSPDLSEHYSIPPASLPTVAGVPMIKPSFGFAYKQRAKTRVLVVGGYALDPSGKDRVGGVVVEIDDKPYRAYYGLPIESVAGAQDPNAAKIQSDPELRDCGFRREFSQQQLPAGPHTIAIKVLAKDRNAWFSSTRPEPLNLPEWPK